ncbi:hypothetical protein EZS27_011261 [termite gut metagenome]|uniref:Uncharacterized protein n=2 Tax=termite gut metagenome TaxID=433724 RepID=A0A5J4S441_9ZZZZ
METEKITGKGSLDIACSFPVIRVGLFSSGNNSVLYLTEKNQSSLVS